MALRRLVDAGRRNARHHSCEWFDSVNGDERLEETMIRREHLDEDRKRAEAYQALAHPAGVAGPEVEESISPILLTHDGEVYEEPAQSDDILEGLDVTGLDPRTQDGIGR
jgi:hypothetical protein